MKAFDQKITEVISAGQVHEQRIMKLEAEVGQVHEQRIMKLEADTKAIGDGMGTFGRHVQAMDDRLKGHIGATVDDLNQAMIAIDVALRQTVTALETRLGEFQGSAQELMNQTHQGLARLQERLADAEAKIHKAVPVDRAASGTAYYDMSSPAKPQQSDPTAGGSAGGWQQQGGVQGYQGPSQGWQQN